MVRVGCRAVAEELRVDPGAAASRMLHLLKDEDDSALADHKPVAVGIVGAGGAAGSSLRVERACIWAKAPTAIGVIDRLGPARRS